MVKAGVVVHRVYVNPVQGHWVIVILEVDVEELGMLADVSIVVLRRVKILDEMVPDVPFPDNGAARRPRRFDFDNVIRVEWKEQGGGVMASLDGLLAGLAFVGDHQHVSVGELDGLVVGAVLRGIVVLELPLHHAVPCYPLDPTSQHPGVGGPKNR